MKLPIALSNRHVHLSQADIEALFGAVCRNYICKSAVILRIAAPVGTEPLSGRNTGKYAGKVPVYAGGSDGCNQWK